MSNKRCALVLSKQELCALVQELRIVTQFMSIYAEGEAQVSSRTSVLWLPTYAFVS